MTKPVSRQRAWQLSQIEKGLCKLCRRKLYLGGLCLEHYAAKRLADRKHYARTKSASAEP